ncbi:MAG: sulfatase [Candidatus Hydrogenedentes bacterium]|nr:sulfatase [Candidatus Hydrogenedentota bacterium]
MLPLLLAAFAAAPDVFIVSVDTLRADRLGCYGHELPTSPNIDAFAKDALLFEDCLAEVPLTSPSFGAMLTSRYPRMNGAARNGLPLPPDVRTITQQFKDAGYQTVCVTSNWTLKRDLSGLDRGFDHYDDGFKDKRWGFMIGERFGDDVTAASLKLIQERDPNKPLFAWFHYSDPHAPYKFHDEFNPAGKALWKLDEVAATRARYDSEVAYTDAEIGKLLAVLPKENAIVLFVADHGESLHEHDYLGHGRRVYQDNIRVPLIIRGPGVAQGRSKDPVRLIDVAPTLLALAGLQPIKDMLGVDLLRAEIPADRARVIETYGGAVPSVPGAKAMMAARPPMRQSVTRGEWKLIIGGPGPELFNLANDPGELKNRIDEEKNRAAELRKLIEDWDAKIPKGSAEAAELDGEDIQALKSLGYVE